MGKAANWFRGLLGLKKLDSPSLHQAPKPSKEKRRWSFVKSYREREIHKFTEPEHNCERRTRDVKDDDADTNKHTIEVVAAAAPFVRLSSSGRCANHVAFVGRVEWAAVKIQSAFRGYLGRKALRALRSVVRLQALVRGHIERKRTAEWLHGMEALLRAQARARAGRIQIFESPSSSGKSSQFHRLGPATPEKLEHAIQAKRMKYDHLSILKGNGSRSSQRIIVDQEKTYVGKNRPGRHLETAISERPTSTRTGNLDGGKSDKILEIGTGKTQFVHKYKNIHHSSRHALESDQFSHSYTNSKISTTHLTVPSSSSCEIQSVSPLKFTYEENYFCSADNSPQVLSAMSSSGSSRLNSFTPSKSDGTKSYLGGYSDHPNYMTYTESSKAKARRSLSAPKQRPQVDRSTSAKRNSINGFGELKSSTHRAFAFHGNKPYPGSGRLDRLGMPIGYKY